MKQFFSVAVKVPATTANLGAGFDVLGLALGLHNEVLLAGWRGKGARPLVITAEGEGADRLPRDRSNLVYRAVEKLWARAKFRKPDAVRLHLVNRIPLARGLGSSSAAIVGGLLAANVVAKNALSPDELLALAADVEGHPDNVAPALLGGLTASSVVDGRAVSVAWKDKALFKGLKFVVVAPSFELSTKKARSVLPGTVSRADAVFNVGRAALFLAAIKERRHDLLPAALEDRLHQPYRKKLIRGFDGVLSSAKKAGAFGACLSGAGPSLLAVSPAGKASRVARAMEQAFARRRVAARALVLDVDFNGAQVMT